MTRNRTELALIARGVDSALARKLREERWTLAKLQSLSLQELADLGIDGEAASAVLGNSRPPIPGDVLVRTLFANRWLCCVCRDESRPIIVHHIKPWAESRDHSQDNLAVLCSIHHGEAHSAHALELTLTSARLKTTKASWEHEVERLDPHAILKATQLQGCQWWYFNHFRVFEIAQQLGVTITELAGFRRAFDAQLCDEDGYPHCSAGPMYNGPAALILSRYMTNMLQVTMDYASVRNISDNLDRGTLSCLIMEGDLIFVQGLYRFSTLPLDGSGSDLVAGLRSVNGVEITFVFDRNEGTSSSARNLWLREAQNLGCLLRVNKLQRDSLGTLHIEATVLAIRSAHGELKSRTYEIGLYKSGLIGLHDLDDEAYDKAFDDEELNEETLGSR